MTTQYHWQTFILLALCGTAFFFATYHLTESPQVWYDEGFYVQSAINLATYGHTGLRVAPDTLLPSSKLITVGYPLIYPLAGWVLLFGTSILSARSLMVVFILAFLLASYVLVRRLYGTTLALCALALLATLPTLYGNGKSVLGEVPGLFLLTTALVCLDYAFAMTARARSWLIGAGLLAGLCVVTKPTFLVLLPALVVAIGIEWRRGHILTNQLPYALVAGALPILLWLLLQFQGGDSLMGILSYYANPYEIQNLSAVILANIGHLFGDIGPLYLMGVMGVWTAALGIRRYRGASISAVEVTAFLFSLLIIVAYLRTAGWYRYLFEAQALSLLFFPNALVVVAQPFFRLITPMRTAIVVSVALSLLGGYQVLFSSFVAESYHRDKTAFLEQYFAHDTSSTVFFYNVPGVALFARDKNYFQYIEPAGGPIGTDQLSVIENGTVDEIVLDANAYPAKADTLFMHYMVASTSHDYLFLKKR